VVPVKTVLFACTHNAGRSQMAAAFFTALADPAKARAISAGTSPGPRVHPVVAEAMAEVGIDLGGATPRLLTPDLAATASRLVTMGCGETCPLVPGLPVEDWELPDPKDRPLAEVRAIRDTIRDRVLALVTAHGWGRNSQQEATP
jgi:arsenate reductase